MTQDKRKLFIPNEHRQPIREKKLKMILDKAGISEEEWNAKA